MLWFFLLLCRFSSPKALARRPILALILFFCVCIDLGATLYCHPRCMVRPVRCKVPAGYKFRSLFGTETRTLGDDPATSADGVDSTDLSSVPDDPADVPGPSQPPPTLPRPKKRTRSSIVASNNTTKQLQDSQDPGYATPPDDFSTDDDEDFADLVPSPSSPSSEPWLNPDDDQDTEQQPDDLNNVNDEEKDERKRNRKAWWLRWPDVFTSYGNDEVLCNPCSLHFDKPVTMQRKADNLNKHLKSRHHQQAKHRTGATYKLKEPAQNSRSKSSLQSVFHHFQAPARQQHFNMKELQFRSVFHLLKNRRPITDYEFTLPFLEVCRCPPISDKHRSDTSAWEMAEAIDEVLVNLLRNEVAHVDFLGLSFDESDNLMDLEVYFWAPGKLN